MARTSQAGQSVGAELSQALGVPYIVEYRGADALVREALNGAAPLYPELYAKADELALRQATVIVAGSSSLKDELIARGIDATRVLVAPGDEGLGRLLAEFVEAQRQDIKAVVLCASFVTNPTAPTSATSPLKWATSLISKPWYDRALTPELLREKLLGEDAPDNLVEKATETLRALKPEVWSSRVQLVLSGDARQELLACEKPILYLQPTEDKFVSRTALEEIRRIKPSVKAATIKGPHALLQRNPREALEAIRSFLDDLPGS